jgi:drug/metabolite transporter (DMT)-like permease
VEPVLILLLASAVLRERIGRTLVIFLAVAVVGVVLVVYQPHATGNAVAVVLTFAAVGSCALYTVLTRRLLLNDASFVVVLVQQGSALAFALVLATIVRLVSHDAWDLDSLSASTWALAGLSGGLYYGLAFWFYHSALRQMPASIAGAFLPMIPIFGVVGGYLIGERLTERQLTGAAVVVLATALIAVSQAPDST